MQNMNVARRKGSKWGFDAGAARVALEAVCGGSSWRACIDDGNRMVEVGLKAKK